MSEISSSLLLQPALLKKMERLQLVPRRVYQGGQTGARKSRSRGTGMEFADHREYSPGDDFRTIDWNVYARLDDLIVKTFETDQNLNVLVLVDTSESMRFGAPSKLRFAASLAAAIGYLALLEEDGVTLTAVADSVLEGISSGRQSLSPARLFDFCEHLEPRGGTRLEETVRSFAFQNRQPGLLFLLSDFLTAENLQNVLQPLGYLGYDVCGIQILAAEELNPDFAGEMDIVDSETGEAVSLTVRNDTRARYERSLGHFLRQTEQAMKVCWAHYVRLTTEVPIERVVLHDFRRLGLVKE
ncbi:MAG: DUF58 domain-containing protein [Planctomycetes bacterium]|nr:DUF58 domain-containing protein [Planctomycetota bacterium]